ncbi:unnamed protein product, partial [Effrenium voratum]
GDIAAGWILEEWFTGQEVDIDGWAKEGQVEWLLISDNKPVLGQGCCETGGLYPSQLPEELQQKLEALTRQVVAACPGLHSAFHFEALVNLETKAVMPVELNLRVGGAECPCCVEAVTGVFLPLCAAELALGRPVTPPSAPKAVVAASSNEYAPCAGTVQACEGSEAGGGKEKELFADEHFLGGAFFAREGASYVPGRGSMSCLCWLAAKGGLPLSRRCGGGGEELAARMGESGVVVFSGFAAMHLKLPAAGTPRRVFAALFLKQHDEQRMPEAEQNSLYSLNAL